jgi:hypothetical protein
MNAHGHFRSILWRGALALALIPGLAGVPLAGTVQADAVRRVPLAEEQPHVTACPSHSRCDTLPAARLFRLSSPTPAPGDEMKECRLARTGLTASWATVTGGDYSFRISESVPAAGSPSLFAQRIRLQL